METNSISVVFIQKPLCNICGPLPKKKNKKTSSDFRSELEQKRGRAQRSLTSKCEAARAR